MIVICLFIIIFIQVSFSVRVIITITTTIITTAITIITHTTTTTTTIITIITTTIGHDKATFDIDLSKLTDGQYVAQVRFVENKDFPESKNILEYIG